ncbi:EF_hand_3 domain-containing protein/EF_hand_5 domain-containing protein [Cephalotus follicularis]|uniref:EF_hand_3 domain-containing protein/EF_hand_5 domain-containing protein n=1 Tax=Cephalotus follicularis TaxID=3775 RepID=A0A1Q3BVA0_CEPFO|nr:EF_hand_3 domain-containing protein/EF_hand_5 domain-containing protein [Cephalotus follicularis]
MCPSGTRTLRLDTNLSSDFRPAFEALDADRDGKISRDDLRMFYAGFSSGTDSSDDIISTMISVADSNKDGFVQYHEFEQVLGYERNSSSAAGVMEDVFRVMDRDGDGKLSHQDLKSYMMWAGFSASEEDIRVMIRLAGGDEKHGVSYDGLLKILAIDNIGL